MATSTSFEEILSIHRLSEGDLNQVYSKEHRDELTKKINDWKAVGAALGFTQEDLDMIDLGYENDGQKKTTLFIQWSMRDKKEATYLNLAKLLFAGGLLDLLQELCILLSRATPTISAGIKKYRANLDLFRAIIIIIIEVNKLFRHHLISL